MRHILALLLGLALCLAAPFEAVPLDSDGIRNDYVAVDVAKVTQGQAAPQVVPMQLEAKWQRIEAKAKAIKEASDKLAAGLRVVHSLSSKKRKADQEYAKQAQLWAHNGAHPRLHKKDLKMPLGLEVATAQKNVMDLRFSRAKAQAELLRRTAVDLGGITGVAAAQPEKEAQAPGITASEAEKESKKAQAKEKQALREYEQFKQQSLQTRLLEKKLESQKAVQQALSRSAAGAQNAKLRQQRVKLQTAAVQAQTAQTGVEVEREKSLVLIYKKQAQDTKHEQQVAGLKEQLTKSKAATKAETKRADEATSSLKALKQDSNQEQQLQQELTKVKP